MNCKNCGSVLDRATGKCPNCEMAKTQMFFENQLDASDVSNQNAFRVANNPNRQQDIVRYQSVPQSVSENNYAPGSAAFFGAASGGKETSAQRSALIWYLEDLRAMEIAKICIYDRLEFISKKTAQLCRPRKIFKPTVAGKSIGLFIAVFFLVFIIVFCCSFFFSGNNYLLDSDAAQSALIALCFALAAGFITVGLVIVSYAFKLKEYKKALLEEQARMNRENVELLKWRSQQANLENANNDLKRLLNRAYASNLIPVHLRNAHGVIYLYEYLCSSQESLSSAIMNYNMNHFGKKQFAISEQQKEQIMQQYYANMENKRNKNWHSQLGEQLRQTGGSSDQNANYLALLTLDSSVMSYFLTYDCFRKEKGR